MQGLLAWWGGLHSCVLAVTKIHWNVGFSSIRGLVKCSLFHSSTWHTLLVLFVVCSLATTLRGSLVLLMDLKTSHNSPVFVDPLPSLALPSAVMAYTTPTSFPSSGLYLNTPKKKPLPSKIEEVRAAGWLDLMLASSPPRKRQSKEFFLSDVQADDLDMRHRNWMVCIWVYSIW